MKTTMLRERTGAGELEGALHEVAIGGGDLKGVTEGRTGEIVGGESVDLDADGVCLADAGNGVADGCV